jgi:hypothetical protein
VESHNPVVNQNQSIRTAGTVAAARADQYSPGPEVVGVRVRGKVRGNVKFSYLVFA